MMSAPDNVACIRTLLADEELCREFLPAAFGHELRALAEHIEPVYRQTRLWASRFAILNSAVLLPTAVFKVLCLPSLAPQNVCTTVKWELWAFGMDDLFDAHRRSFAELKPIMDDLYRVAVSIPGTEMPSSEFAVCLLEIKQELALHPIFRYLQPMFVGTVGRLVEGMMYSYTMQPYVNSLDLPPLDEYLHHTSRVFEQALVWMLPLFDDESVLPKLGELSKLIDSCTRCLRLANDLGTFAREENEGTLNGVVIKMTELKRLGWADGPDLRAAALEELRVQLVTELRRARDIGRTISTRTEVERVCVRLPELAIGMFQRHEPRVWHADLLGAQDRMADPRGASGA